MQSIRQVKRLNDLELEKCIPPNASWHTDYRDTAYIYIGGLPFELSEGDVLAIFSQYGNPAHIKLVRDQDTGKSRGFCFLKYEDQRSCDLAVDNLSGASVMGRILSVDHTRYKKKEGEVEGLGDVEEDEGDDTEREDDKPRDKKRIRSGSEEAPAPRRLLKEEVELQKLLVDHDEDDPMKSYLVEQKKEEVKEAKKRAEERTKTERSHRHHRHRSDRDRRDRTKDHHRPKQKRDGSEVEQTRDGKQRSSRRREHSDDEMRRERRSHRKSTSPTSDRAGERQRDDRRARSRRDDSRPRTHSRDRDRDRDDR